MRVSFFSVRYLCTGWRSVFRMEERWSDAEHDELDVIRAVYCWSETTHWLRCQSQSCLPLTAALCLAVIHSAYVLYFR